MDKINRFLILSSVFLILLVFFVAAQKPTIGYKLLSPDLRSGMTFINLVLAVLIVIFASSVSRSATTGLEAWGHIVIGTIFLALLTLSQVFRGISFLYIQGLENILWVLFLFFLLVGFYKLRHSPVPKKQGWSRYG